MPACDTCRIRKIRCDRQSPCGPCKSSKFECNTSSRKPRVARNTAPTLKLSADCAASTVSLTAIKPKSINNADEPRGQNKLNNHFDSALGYTSYVPPSPSNLSQLPGVSLVDAESLELGGDSSLHAHSIDARNLLVQTLGDHSHVRDNPKIVTALNSLRQIVEADGTKRSRKKRNLTGLDEPRHSLYELKLPPTELILDVLRKSKERTIFVFSPPLAFISRDQFSDLCKTVFFRTEDYPVSTAVIVHGVLERILQEFKWPEKDPELRRQYGEWAQLCRENLEISISNLDVLISASTESAQALVFATAYCMEIGQASLCKKLAVNGCMMVQSLGWHRSSCTKNDDALLRQQKIVMFWMLYIIDKHLSLRLGQASLIQDYDIDLPLPWVDPSAPLASLGRIRLWVNTGRVMGLLYQRLYSPGALKQTDTARFEAVQEFLQIVETIKPQSSEKDCISQFIQDPGIAPATYLYDVTELILKSDEVTYYALLCMIYRATPISVKPTYDPATECIKYARAALDCHRRCAITLKGRSELWEVYLHWTILNTPFVPFTTVFSHVLTTRDRVDLERLQHFAESMSGCLESSPAHKISRLASVFVNVASIYVELREQEAGNMSVESQGNTHGNNRDRTTAQAHQQEMSYTMPAWEPFNSMLDALGFAETSLPSGDGNFSESTSLENWFNGNQLIMGLLEDDLSYLDSTAFTF